MKRNKMQQDMLLENLEEKVGETVQQDYVIKLLNLSDSEKKHVTKLVKTTFPNVSTTRKTVSGHSTKLYVGLRRKISFPSSFESQGSPDQLIFYDIPEVKKLKDHFEDLNKELADTDAIMERELNSETTKETILLLFQRQSIIMRTKESLHNALERLYEEEMQKLLTNVKRGEISCAESEELDNEIIKFTTLLDFDMENVDKDIHFEKVHLKLSSLPNDLKEKCPLIYNIAETLLLTKSDQTVQSDRRVRSAMHALAILLSQRNQKLQNNFKLMFTTLCVSYGAGESYNYAKPGLAMSWTKFVEFLDKRLKNKPNVVNEKCKDMMPIILLMDNINMYRGKRKHLRLLKYLGPTMWNFTGRGLFIPNMEKFSSCEMDKETCIDPQKDVLIMDPSELFIEHDADKLSMWNKDVEKYLLEVLDSALNKLPPIPRDQPLRTMTDQEVQKWLKSSDFEKSSKQMNYKASVPQKIAKDRIGARESQVEQLLLSLEDNSTIAGTLNILSDFATLFDLPNSHFLKEYCPFDTAKMKFDIKLAQAHFELKLTMHNHQNCMANLNE